MPVEEPVFRALGLAAGVALLVFGRRLFWLAVGALGFLVGFGLFGAFAEGIDPRLTLVLGLAAGVAGAVLAVAVQRFAIVVAGFLLAALAVHGLLPGLVTIPDAQLLVVSLLGGLVGALLALGVANLALRIVTAGVGSLLLVEAAGLPGLWERLAFGLLWLLGFLAQGGRRPE